MKGFTPGDPRAMAAAKKGSRVSAEQRRLKRRFHWASVGVDPALGESIRRDGYQAGYQAGRRAGQKREQA